MAKAYFQYYETFEKIVMKFKTKEAQDAFRAKIVNYGLFGVVPELDDYENMVWETVQDLIDDQAHRRQTNAKNRKGKSHTEISFLDENDKEHLATTENELKRNETTCNESKRNATTDNETERLVTTEKEILDEKSRFAELDRNGLDRSELERTELERNISPQAAKPPALLENQPHSQNSVCFPTKKIISSENQSQETICKHKNKPFIPPTVEGVAAYCKERGNSVDAESFVAFYSSKGWMVGKNKMRDWKQAVITWEKRQRGYQARGSPAAETRDSNGWNAVHTVL